MNTIILQDDTTFCINPVILHSNPLEKMAMFDVDGTIIKPKSGARFAQDESDWEFLYNNVPDKIRSYHNDGFTIVFISNQMGISKGKTDIGEFITKITNVIDIIGVPITVIFSTKNDYNRKPSLGMWDKINEYLSKWDSENRQTIQLVTGSVHNTTTAFYCGDAAGRDGDFSNSDLNFAINIHTQNHCGNFEFYTPENMFLGEGPIIALRCVRVTINPNESVTIGSTQKQELIINVGCAGSGKTTFTKQFMLKYPDKYIYINRDTLGTTSKCITFAKKQLALGKSVIIDNTNPSIENREKYINLISEIDIRCFYFTTSREISKHNMMHRHYISNIQCKGIDRVPDVAYRVYWSKFSEPSLDEGFSEICNIDFTSTVTDVNDPYNYVYF